MYLRILLCLLSGILFPLFAESGKISFLKLELGSRISDELRQKLESVRRGELDSLAVSNLDGVLKNWYWSHGYPKARWSWKLRQERFLTLNVQKGSRYRWGKLFLNGNTRSTAQVVRRLSLLPEEGNFDGRLLDLARDRLARRAYFSVSDFEVAARKNRNQIHPLLFLEDAKVNRVEATLGASSGNSSARDKKKVEGVFLVDLQNILGTARDLRVYFASANFGREVEGAYLEPWLFGSSWSMPLSADFLEEDSSYRRIQWQVGLERPISFTGKIGIQLGLREDVVFFSDKSSEKSGTVWSGISSSYDSRSRAVFPTRGVALKNEVKLLDVRGTNLHQRSLSFRPSLASIYRLGDRFFAHLDAGGGGFFPRRQNPGRSTLFEAGGFADLRGFPERFFHTQTYAWLLPMLSWRPDEKSALGLFVQGGAVDRRGPSRNWKGIFSWGGSLERSRGAWSLLVQYAVYSENRPSEGYLHVQVGNRF